MAKSVSGKKKHQHIKPVQKPLAEKSKSSVIGSPLIWLFVICAVTFIIYARSIGYGFIYNWDDAGYILKNEYIKNLSFSGIAEIFSSFYMHNYHPLTTLMYSIEYSLVGENAWLYHLNNIILHLVNIVLVYKLMLLLFKGKQMQSLFVAALFAMHPMHVESVAWVSERKDVLYTMFYLLSLLYYVNYIRSKQMRDLLMTGLFFVLSCMSKSAAVTLPVLMLAFDYLERRQFQIKVIAEKIPFFLVSLLFGILAIMSQDTAIQDLTPILSFFERLLIVFYGIVLYLVKSILPLQLSAFYPYPLKVDDVLPWYFFVAPLVVIAIAYFIWYSRKWGREVIFGFAFFFITISLVLQLMPVGGAILAERYTYVPYLGLFFALMRPFQTDGTEKRANLKTIGLYKWILICVIILFSFLSFQRVSFWKNGDILFTDVIKKYPLFPYAYNNRGFLYFDYYSLKLFADNPVKKAAFEKKALEDYNMAIQLDPSYVSAYANRAVLLYNTGNPEPALADFNTLLKLDPDNVDGLLGRANTLSSLQQFTEAIPDYTAYLQIKPDDGKAYVWRGIAYARTNVYEEAMLDFDKAISIIPDDYEGYYWKGVVLYNQKNYQEALPFLDKAISLNPDFFELFSWRGLVYFELKIFDRAISDFSTAIQINPSELSTYVNRSLAYNESGKFMEAYTDLIYAAERGFPISKPYYEGLVNKIKIN